MDIKCDMMSNPACQGQTQCKVRVLNGERQQNSIEDDDLTSLPRASSMIKNDMNETEIEQDELNWNKLCLRLSNNCLVNKHFYSKKISVASTKISLTQSKFCWKIFIFLLDSSEIS